MATIGSLMIKIGVDNGGLRKGLDNAGGMVRGGAGKMGGALKAGLAVGVGAATVGLAAVGGAAIGIGAASFDMANQMSAAQGQIQAQLGTTTEEAEALAQVAQNVFANNFAGSVTEAADALIETRQQMGDLPQDQLQAATENALRLSDAYGTDLSQNLNSAQTLMSNFGVSQEEAFDILSGGFQKGLNNSGDFLDSIGEYSNVFADSGFSADQMFSIMETGMQSGVLGTDKIADSIKEMGIILNEGTDDSRAAFEMMGLDFDQIADSVASGDATWGDYFDQIVGGINGIEDPIARSQAQVAIFGSMAEDMGNSFTNGLSATSTSMDDLAGSTEKLDAQYNTLGSRLEGMKRQALVALAPLGEGMLSLAESAMPALEEGLGRVINSIEPFKTAFSALAEGDINTFINTLALGLSELGLPFDDVLSKLNGFRPAMEGIKEAITNGAAIIEEGMTRIGNAIEPFQNAIAALQEGDINGFINGLALGLNELGLPFETTLTKLNGLRDFMTEAKGLFGEFAEEFAAKWDEAGPRIEGALKRISDVVSPLFDGFETGSVNVDLFGVALGVLEGVLDGVLLVIDGAVITIEAIAGAVEWVKEAFENASAAIDAFGVGLAGAADNLPEWLKPGSPPPLYWALRDIGGAIRDLPDMDGAFAVSYGNPLGDGAVGQKGLNNAGLGEALGNALAPLSGGGEQPLVVNVYVGEEQIEPIISRRQGRRVAGMAALGGQVGL